MRHALERTDQDSIAAIMADRTKWIDEKWNYCVTPLWVDQSQFDQAALDRAGIAHFIADENMSVLDGSINALSRRLMVDSTRIEEARRLIEGAGLGDELRPRT